MTEVDFYVVDAADEDAVLRTACRVAQKAWGQGLRVYILADTDENAARMDDLLWTFQQDSFVPHERWHGVGASNAIDEPLGSDPADIVSQFSTESAGHAQPMARVLIGTTTQLPTMPELLINLGAAMPEWFAQCPRVAEIVGATPHRKTAGRERYRVYREQGVPLRTHEV
ncbi:MAG: DNA polymerase-3 subunit chi [Gammaproteobacteria bacterium]|jgi:DNA polymerase-3 subunit chi